MARDPDKFRRELEDKLQAAIQKHCGTGNKTEACFAFERNTIPDPAGGSARPAGRCPHPAPVEPAATASGGLPPLLIEPPEVIPTAGQTPPPPQRVESDVEKMARVNAEGPPGHYLKRPESDEPWRQFIGPDGEIRTSPWRRR
jgi:hypothetical protein